MWNRGNPAVYSDLSGFNPWTGPAPDQDLQAAEDGNLFEFDDTGSQLSEASGDGDRHHSVGMLHGDPGVTSAEDNAAAEATKTYHDVAKRTHTEWGGRIVCNVSKTECSWTLSPDSGNHRINGDGIRGGEVNSEMAPEIDGYHTVAFWHVHWMQVGFSPGDAGFSANRHMPLYVGLPNGELWRTLGYDKPMAYWHGLGEYMVCSLCAK